MCIENSLYLVPADSASMLEIHSLRGKWLELPLTVVSYGHRGLLQTLGHFSQALGPSEALKLGFNSSQLPEYH